LNTLKPAHRLGELGQLEGDAQVRLVAAVARHRVGVGKAREWRQLDVEHAFPDVAHQALHEVLDLALGQERGLDVDLGELGLAVGAQVLVAEALHDLVVAVEARDHEQLLEQLRRLRQRIELPVVDARGHEELTRAFGRGLVEDGGLDVDEAVLVEILAHGTRGRVAHAQDLLHRGAAQVEEAVLEPHLLGDLLVVHQEGRRGSHIEDLDLVREDLDLAALQVRIHGAFGTAAHQARHAQHELVAHAVRGGEGLLAVGVAHHLHETLAVAQVDEDHAAVVAAPMRPPVEGDRLAEETGIGIAAVFGAHDVSCHSREGGSRIDGVPAVTGTARRSFSGSGSEASPARLRPWR
jgi:hypothetical protein